MKKNKYYFWILLFIIVSGSAYLLTHNRWSTSQDEFSELLLNNANKIETLLITNGNDSVFISKKEDLWYLGEEELNATAVNNLVYAAGNLALKGMMQDDDIKDIQHKAELSFYDAKKELCRFEFLATSFSYFIHSFGSEKVYEVELPGHEDLLLEKVFSTEENHYRKHVIIDLLPSEIASLKVKPINGTSFFVKADTASYLSIFEVNTGESRVADADIKKIQMLLSYFSAIRYERVLAIEKVFPEGLPDEALSVIELVTKEGEEYILEVFPLYDSEKQDVDMFFAAVRYNGQEQLLKMNYYYLDLLMRGLEHYSE